jgi:hypothetical protein
VAKRLKKHLYRLDSVGMELVRSRQRISVLEARVRVLEGEAEHRASLRVRGIIAARTRLLSALETLSDELLSVLSEVEARG